MSITIDASMSLDEILATIQLSSELPRFKCNRCGIMHTTGWSSCYNKLKQHAPRAYCYNRSFPHTAVLPAEDLRNGTTTITMPKIYTSVPRIFPYKIALQPDKTIPLLKEYIEIHSSMPKPPSIELFEKRVPISLMLSPEQYRELIYRLMDSPQYQNYVAQLMRSICSIANFIIEHTDLFIPSTPNRIEVYFDDRRHSRGPFLTDIIVVLPDSDKPVSLNYILSQADLGERDLYYVLHESYNIMPLNGAIDGSALVHPGRPGGYANSEYSCLITLPGIISDFRFAFDINFQRATTLNCIDRTDAVTARLQEICDELGQIARPAFEAIMEAYAADIYRMLRSKEVQRCSQKS